MSKPIHKLNKRLFLYACEVLARFGFSFLNRLCLANKWLSQHLKFEVPFPSSRNVITRSRDFKSAIAVSIRSEH